MCLLSKITDFFIVSFATCCKFEEKNVTTYFLTHIGIFPKRDEFFLSRGQKVLFLVVHTVIPKTKLAQIYHSEILQLRELASFAIEPLRKLQECHYNVNCGVVVHNAEVSFFFVCEFGK
jgi:hypothetical protein